MANNNDELIKNVLSDIIDNLDINESSDNFDENDISDNFDETDNENLNENNIHTSNFLNFINLIGINSNATNREFDTIINSQIAIIFDYAHQHYLDCPDELIEQINLCYLRNLQYDDEDVTELIRYTIRLIFIQITGFNLNEIVSGILNYSMISNINYIFNTNIDIVYNIIQTEISRLFAHSMARTLTRHILLNNETVQFDTGEDIRLTIEQNELDKLEKTNFNLLDTTCQEKNNKCLICQDQFTDENIVYKFKCEHVFHCDCSNEWFLKYSIKCPTCKQNVTDNYKANT